MESVFDDLHQSVQCSLCNQTMQEPKLLKCFHTFCKSCIQRHAQPIEQVNIFKCPQCSSETLLQELSDVEDLKPSLLHSRMLQVLAFSESQKSCSVSESHSPASWQCFDCDRSLCDECLKNHSIFTKDHRVVSLSDVKNEELESMILKSKASCKTHSGHNMELFCTECEVLVCLLCLKDHHNSHKTQTLQEVTSTKKDLLLNNLEEIQRLESNEIEMKQQEEVALKILKDGQEAKNKVQKMTKTLVKYLLDQEEQLLNEIQRSVAKAERNLHLIHYTAAAKEYMKSIMGKGIASAGDMVDYVNTFTYDPFPSDTSRLKFCPNKSLSDKVTTTKLGQVRLTLKSDSKLSKIEIDSEAMAMRKAKLTIVTKQPTGDLSYNDSDLVDIQLSPKNSVNVEENNLRTIGKIQVEFMPRLPGQLTAEVKLNGIPVSNSPLVMDIMPQNMVQIYENSKLKTALNKVEHEDSKKKWKKELRSKNTSGIAVNKTNSRIAAALNLSSPCVRVYNMDGQVLLNYLGERRGKLQSPQGLAFLDDTDLVILDNHRICIVNTKTRTLMRTFGRHGIGNGEFLEPRGVHVDDDCNIIVSDTGNGRVQVFTRNGDYRYHFTVPDQDDFQPHSTVTHNGLFYVSDMKNGIIHVIQMKDGSPSRLSTIGEKGDGVGQLQSPCGLAIDDDHNLLVCDTKNMVITKFTLDGSFVGQTSGCRYKTEQIAVLNDGQFACAGHGVYSFNSDWCVVFYQA